MIFEPMAAKKTSAKKLTKSSFIRSQPPEMSAAEIVAKGKAAGMKISDSLVYMVRGPKDGKASGKKTGAKKSASKKASPKKAKKTSTATAKTATSTKGAQSKADFVRARGHLSPKEIVEDAKAAGVELGVTYVYNVRGQDKAVASKKARASKTSAATTASTKSPPSKSIPALNETPGSTGSRPSGSASSVEDLLRAVAAEIGLGRAMEILAGERARVRAMMGG